MQQKQPSLPPLTPIKSHSSINTDSFYSAAEDQDDDANFSPNRSETSSLHGDSHSFQQPNFTDSSTGDLRRILLKANPHDNIKGNSLPHQQHHRTSTSSTGSLGSFNPLPHLAEGKDVDKFSAIYKSMDLGEFPDLQREDSRSTVNHSRNSLSSKAEADETQVPTEKFLKRQTIVPPPHNTQTSPGYLFHLRRSGSIDSSTSSDSSVWTTTSDNEDNEVLKVKNVQTEASYESYEAKNIRKQQYQQQLEANSSAQPGSSFDSHKVSVKRSVSTLRSKSSNLTMSTFSQESPNSSYTLNYDNDNFTNNSVRDFRQNSAGSLLTDVGEVYTHDARLKNISDDEQSDAESLHKQDLTNTSTRSTISLKKKKSIQAIQEFLRFSSSGSHKKSSTKNSQASVKRASSVQDPVRSLSPIKVEAPSKQNTPFMTPLSTPSSMNAAVGFSQTLMPKAVIDETSTTAEHNSLSTPLKPTKSNDQLEDDNTEQYSDAFKSSDTTELEQSPSSQTSPTVVLNSSESTDNSSSNNVSIDDLQQQLTTDAANHNNTVHAISTSSPITDATNTKADESLEPVSQSPRSGPVDYVSSSTEPKTPTGINHRTDGQNSGECDGPEDKKETTPCSSSSNCPLGKPPPSTLPLLPLSCATPQSADLAKTVSPSSSVTSPALSNSENVNTSPEFSSPQQNISSLDKNYAPKLTLSELDEMISSGNKIDDLYPFSSSTRQKNASEQAAVHNLPGAPKIFMSQAYPKVLNNNSNKNETLTAEEQQKRKEDAAKELAAQFSLAMSRLPPLPGFSFSNDSLSPSPSQSSPETPSFSMHDIDGLLADTPTTIRAEVDGGDITPLSTQPRPGFFAPPFANGLGNSNRSSLAAYSANRPSSLAFSASAESPIEGDNSTIDSKENLDSVNEPSEQASVANESDSLVVQDNHSVASKDIKQLEDPKKDTCNLSVHDSQPEQAEINSPVDNKPTQQIEESSPANSNYSSNSNGNKSRKSALIEHALKCENDVGNISSIIARKAQNRLSQTSLSNHRLSADMLPPLPLPPAVHDSDDDDRLTPADIDAMVENGDDVENLHPLATKSQNRLSQNRFSAEFYPVIPGSPSSAEMSDKPTDDNLDKEDNEIGVEQACSSSENYSKDHVINNSTDEDFENGDETDILSEPYHNDHDIQDRLSEVLNFDVTDDKTDDIDLDNIVFGHHKSFDNTNDLANQKPASSSSSSSTVRVYNLPGAPKIFDGKSSSSSIPTPNRLAPSNNQLRSKVGSIKSTESRDNGDKEIAKEDRAKELAEQFSLAMSRLPPLPGTSSVPMSPETEKPRFAQADNIFALEETKKSEHEHKNASPKSQASHTRTQSAHSILSSHASLTCREKNMMSTSGLSTTTSLTSAPGSDNNPSPTNDMFKGAPIVANGYENGSIEKGSHTVMKFASTEKFDEPSYGIGSHSANTITDSKQEKDAKIDSLPHLESLNVENPVNFSVAVSTAGTNILSISDDNSKKTDSQFSVASSNSSTINYNSHATTEYTAETNDNSDKLSLKAKRSINKMFHRAPASPTHSIQSSKTIGSLKSKIFRFNAFNSANDKMIDDYVTQEPIKSEPLPLSVAPKLPELAPTSSISAESITGTFEVEASPTDENTLDPKSNSSQDSVLPISLDTNSELPNKDRDASEGSTRLSTLPETSISNSNISVSSFSSFSNMLENPQQIIDAMNRADSNSSLRNSLVSSDMKPKVEDITGKNSVESQAAKRNTVMKHAFSVSNASRFTKDSMDYYEEDDDEAILANIQETLPLDKQISNDYESSQPFSNSQLANSKKNNGGLDATRSGVLAESSSATDTSITNAQHGVSNKGDEDLHSTHTSASNSSNAKISSGSVSDIQTPSPSGRTNRSSYKPSTGLNLRRIDSDLFSIGSEDEANLEANARAAQFIDNKRSEIYSNSDNKHLSLFSGTLSHNLEGSGASAMSSSSGPIVDENGKVLCSPRVEVSMLVLFTLFPLLWLLLACGGLDRIVGKVSRKTRIIAACLAGTVFAAVVVGLAVGLSVSLA